MLFHSCFSGKLQNEIGNCILVVKYLQDCPLLVTSCSPFFFPLNSLFRVSFAFPYCLYSGFPGGSDGKASTCNAGDLGSIPGSGRSPGERNGNPFLYSCLEIPMDRNISLNEFFFKKQEISQSSLLQTFSPVYQLHWLAILFFMFLERPAYLEYF